MKTNVSGFDGAMRVLLALIALFFGVVYSSWWGLLGVIPFATATVSWCPIYAILGINKQN